MPIDFHPPPAAPASPCRLRSSNGVGGGVTGSERLRRLSEMMRIDLALVDGLTGRVRESTSEEFLPRMPVSVWRQLRRSDQPHIVDSDPNYACCVLPLKEGEDDAVAVGFAFREQTPSDEMRLSAVEFGWSEERLTRWVGRQPVGSASLLSALTDSAWRQLELEDELRETCAELSRSAERHEQTCEEITLLHGLARQTQSSHSRSELAETCLTRLHSLVRSGGTAVWIDDRRGDGLHLRGKAPFDEIGLAQIVARFDGHDWSQPLIRNDLDQTVLGVDFPGLRNIAVAAVGDAACRAGWIACCNLPRGREFGPLEASLLHSVATILGTQIRNLDLDEQRDEMLVSFVRSLVSALDAKDPYTRGHSERVALVARRLGQELGLPPDDLHDIYLSGLLHDLGKVGVDDRVLRKTDKLTDEEFAHIKQHPMIGYTILVGLKDLRQVLMGVRYHHERYDGAGYPDGLKGEEIPLMARILAVADSYDAMGSNRSYRAGMPLERVEQILRMESGTQWDPRVIDAYFVCREDIRHLCANWQPDEGNLLTPAE